ncbi:hypothetical protein, partial [Glutamicibacter sp. V16R2B1]|uniref:hypothetical protein n=1 Tax=Glutamicibacter sp. V16R2B1 TaxID=2036207 RepID=UPI001BB266B5
GAGGRDLGMWEGCFFRYTTSPKMVLHHSKVVNRIVKNREKKMRENGWRVWQPSATDPILFIVVDEMATFGSSPYGIDIADNVGQSAKKNRAVGVVYLTTTQYAMGLNALGNDVLRGMHNRFQFRDQDGGASLLEEQYRKPIPRDAHGTFYGESYGETRKVSATAIWTPDEERAEIVAKWAGRQTRIDAEWEQAEREVLGTAHPGPEAPNPPVDETPAAPDSDDTVDGEVLIVQDMTFEPIRDLPGRRSEMAFDEADRAFKDLLRTAGRATHEEVQQLTGWRRGKVREFLIAPAMDAGWLDFEDEDGTRYYTPVPEWLEAERGE